MKKTMLSLIVGVMALAGLSAAIVPSQDGAKPLEVSAIEGTHVDTWDKLKSAVKKASTNETIVVDADLASSGDGSDRIVVDGKFVTIDLNGHTLDRKRSSSSSNGHAIEVQGHSIVTFQSSGDMGLVKGGYAENGGAVNIHDGSHATFENIRFADNKASIDGGAIYTRGYLTMANCTIENNEAKDTGGGIYVSDDGYFELDNVTINANTAKNDGGGINGHLDADSTIKNSTITFNKSTNEDGGGICLDASGVTLTITNSHIEDNQAKENGGGICVEDGKLILDNSTLKRNSGELGGGVYVDDEVVIRNGTLFEANVADNGGGIYNNDDDLTIENSTFKKNTAKNGGGAIYLEEGDTKISNSTFTENDAQLDCGGAIYVEDDSDLSIDGGSFTENFAFGSGGAIYVEQDIKIKGALVVENNQAPRGDNVYLDEDQFFIVNGSLSGARIGVEKYLNVGKIASEYSKDNDEIDPSSIFFSSHNFAIERDGSNINLVTPTSIVPPASDPKVAFPFIPEEQTVTKLGKKIGGSNWLSGISGERYLNEINIPGTHDTAMRKVGISAGTLSFGDFYADCAVTQRRYMTEQLEAGVRYIDIRLNNRYVDDVGIKNGVGDDGIHLWQCHGKSKGGTYWAEDENGNLMHFEMVLDWCRQFLTRNPTECIIMGLNDECYYKKYVPTVYDRAKKILKEYDEQYPGFLYFEDGDVSKFYSKMPQLKDVRGKILIEPDEKGYGLGGFNSYSKYNKTAGQKTDRLVWWDKKLKDVNDFYANPDHQWELPKGGEPWEHAGNHFKIGLNCAPQGDTTGIPEETPNYHAKKLFEKLFYQEEYYGVPNAYYGDLRGKYLGWIKTDGATEKEWGKLWGSNFTQSEQDYATVTVDPSLEDTENYKPKTYTVLRNTAITIPDFNYVYDEVANNNYFEGWTAGGENHKAGDAFVVTEDITFSAKWSKASENRDVSIDVVFRDYDDIDGYRPDSITVSIDGGNRTIGKADNWHIVYSGVPSTIEPVIPEHYAFELSGDISNGYVLSFTYTKSEKYGSTSGKITWEDDSNYDQMRPAYGSLKVTLMDGETEVKEVPVDENYAYDFGDDVEKYRDGKPIDYKVVIKSGFAYASEYALTQNGFDLRAFHEPLKELITVDLIWLDDGDEASRPESVTVNVKSGGAIVDNMTITPEVEEEVDEKGHPISVTQWHGEITLPRYASTAPGEEKEELTYTLFTSVEGYTATSIPNVGLNGCVILLRKNAYLSPEVDEVVNLIKNIGEVEYTQECIDKIDAARTAYDALTESQQSEVYNYPELRHAEEEFESKFGHLRDIDARINAVCDALSSTVISRQNEVVKDLSKDVFRLTFEERNCLFNLARFNAAILNSGELKTVYDTIFDIGDVTFDASCKAKIDAARSAYDALTDEQKALIDNYQALVDAEARYAALKADHEAAEKSEALIDAIGEVAYTDECKAKIDAARSAYDALTEDQQALVGNVETLTSAESAYASLKANHEAAEKVESLIDAIGTVERTDECKAKIDAARSAYDALTDEQKTLVRNYQTLLNAEKAYAEMAPAAPSEGVPTGAVAGIVFGLCFVFLLILLGVVFIPNRKKKK